MNFQLSIGSDVVITLKTGAYYPEYVNALLILAQAIEAKRKGVSGRN